ncbi:uncharacterized protein BJ171DRAFT_500578 [Polychytrium aggregatum]|uniref:uncharacterized protein n=1 Tax=Polychytrium aggregatum TaxID=110093 RepID=UPI0022FE6502|nr:uncharacterized protein BJ171DRAFT_500578 [Polychytrium aggregatum]KAI9205473.1 hypothetical protein BJ171DRAFT_500578 [Polychytrium aggregatum]
MALARSAALGLRALNKPAAFSGAVSSRSYSYGYNIKDREAPEAGFPAASEIWSNNHVPPSAPKVPVDEPDAVLTHPVYTPLPKPNTSIGPMAAPLKWPEYDQRLPSADKSGLPSPAHWHYREFDDQLVAPTGDYPRDVPFQWTQLKDPFKYWDQQGRRNYGEILHDQDAMTDWLGIGPEPHWGPLAWASVKFLGVIGTFATVIYLWDPSKHMHAAARDYPFDGLRVELGSDPADPNDRVLAARTLQH